MNDKHTNSERDAARFARRHADAWDPWRPTKAEADRDAVELGEWNGAA